MEGRNGSLGAKIIGGFIRRSWWDFEVPKPSSFFHQILPAQQPLRPCPLHRAVHVVQEHMRHPGSPPVSRHHCGGVNRRHPPRRLRKPAPWSVHHDEVPLVVVHLSRQHVQRQPAAVVASYEGLLGRAVGLVVQVADQLVRLGELRPVIDGAGLEVGGGAYDGLHPLWILLQEQRVAAGVQRRPHQGIVAQPEHQEVAGASILEDVEGHSNLVHVLLGRNPGGGVMDNGLHLEVSGGLPGHHPRHPASDGIGRRPEKGCDQKRAAE